MPRPMTTIQCQRAHGSRSSRAGILVVIVRSSTSVTADSNARSRERRTPAAAREGMPAADRPRRSHSLGLAAAETADGRATAAPAALSSVGPGREC